VGRGPGRGGLAGTIPNVIFRAAPRADRYRCSVPDRTADHFQPDYAGETVWLFACLDDCHARDVSFSAIMLQNACYNTAIPDGGRCTRPNMRTIERSAFNGMSWTVMESFGSRSGRSTDSIQRGPRARHIRMNSASSWARVSVIGVARSRVAGKAAKKSCDAALGACMAGVCQWQPCPVGRHQAEATSSVASLHVPGTWYSVFTGRCMFPFIQEKGCAKAATSCLSGVTS
jgi:hypothetical protein